MEKDNTRGATNPQIDQSIEVFFMVEDNGKAGTDPNDFAQHETP